MWLHPIQTTQGRHHPTSSPQVACEVGPRGVGEQSQGWAPHWPAEGFFKHSSLRQATPGNQTNKKVIFFSLKKNPL